MEMQVKQRIIGGVVVVAVLAIFLPVLLHKPKATIPVANVAQQQTQVSQLSIPAAAQAQVATTSTQTVVQHAQVSPAAISAQTVSHHPQNIQHMPIEQPATVKVLPAKPAIKPVAHHARKPHAAYHTVHHSAHHLAQTHRGINNKILRSAVDTPQAWVVQLASFGDKHNASRLVGRLQKQGMDAYTRATYSGGHEITRVFVGPEIKRGNIFKVAHRLSRQFHLYGVIKRYVA